MKTVLDCIPCFVRQAFDAVEMTRARADEQECLMRDVLKWIGDTDRGQTPSGEGIDPFAQASHQEARP